MIRLHSRVILLLLYILHIHYLHRDLIQFTHTHAHDNNKIDY